MPSTYQDCLITAKHRYDSNQLAICPIGYCTAKEKFEVYPSAYANGYAVQVCKGEKPNYLGQTAEDGDYVGGLAKERSSKVNDLQRWYDEAWVNVCEKGKGSGGYKTCGSGKGINNPKQYPYCRPYYKLPGTTVVTAPELSQDQIKSMCRQKRSLKQGVYGRPTRVYLKPHVGKHQVQKGGVQKPKTAKIPSEVREAATLGLKLIEGGYLGGTQTGWDRGQQLSSNDHIDVGSLADMRTWFARHGPDAINGGTSYPGYCQWLLDGMPFNGDPNLYRGAVSWLIWGGDPAYKWLKSKAVRKLIEAEFPNRKRSTSENNLLC